MIKCPVNQKLIRYTLIIQTMDRVMAEAILEVVDSLPFEGFHEDIADLIADKLPGQQFLCAHHHGVDIETVRGGA